MRNLTFVFDYICPYSYIMIPTIRKLEQENDVKIHWIPMEIHPDTPEEGVNLKVYFGARRAEKEARLVETLAQTREIPFYMPIKLFNTKKALLLTAYGRTRIDVKEIIDELYRRVFIYDEDIGNNEIIQKVCMNLGLCYGDFIAYEKNKLYQNTIAHWEEIVQKFQIQVVPTLFEGEQVLCQGVYSYEELVRRIL